MLSSWCEEHDFLQEMTKHQQERVACRQPQWESNQPRGLCCSRSADLTVKATAVYAQSIHTQRSILSNYCTTGKLRLTITSTEFYLFCVLSRWTHKQRSRSRVWPMRRCIGISADVGVQKSMTNIKWWPIRRWDKQPEPKPRESSLLHKQCAVCNRK